MNTLPDELRPYAGLSAQLDSPAHAAVFLENSTVSRTVYRPGSVDHVFFDHAVVLNHHTASAIYSSFTAFPQSCEPGSRPFLEKIVAHVTANLTKPLDKALALMDFIRDLPRTYPHTGTEAFLGGTEEQVIQKGSIMCNETTRALNILAQIAAIPSRYVGHMIPINYDHNTTTGHAASELHLNGAWAYFDGEHGRFFEKSDGSLASALDLVNDPSLIDAQSDHVTSHIRPDITNTYTHSFFGPEAVHIFVNYLASDHTCYDYSWVFPCPSLFLEAKQRGRALRTTVHKNTLPQPRPRIV